jgi:hypothetical protein
LQRSINRPARPVFVNEWDPSDAEVVAQPALTQKRDRLMMLVSVQR